MFIDELTMTTAWSKHIVENLAAEHCIAFFKSMHRFLVRRGRFCFRSPFPLITKKILFKFTLQINHDERMTQNTSSHQTQTWRHETQRCKNWSFTWDQCDHKCAYAGVCMSVWVFVCWSPWGLHTEMYSSCPFSTDNQWHILFFARYNFLGVCDYILPVNMSNLTFVWRACLIVSCLERCFLFVTFNKNYVPNHQPGNGLMTNTSLNNNHQH